MKKYDHQTNFWIFQGKPTIYKTVEAIKANALNSWKVSSHKDKIRKGDKVILWITGNDRGCYALLEVTSGVYLRESSENDKEYYHDPSAIEECEAVKVAVLHDFTDCPVLEKELQSDDAFDSFNVGISGTNFTSNSDQYKLILEKRENVIVDRIRLSTSLNQIFFGAPGTGKTYNTINEALRITDPVYFELNMHNREDLQRRFKELVIQDTSDNLVGQISFCTFHQSFGYEDFIEGIKPEVSGDNNTLSYSIIPGVFKQISNLAQDNWLNFKEERRRQLDFQSAFQRLKDEWFFDREMKFSLKRDGSEFTILGFTDTSIKFRKANGSTSHTLSISTLKNHYYKKSILNYTGVGIYYPGIIEKLEDYSKEEDYKKKLKNFVIIIDEINRGNIASIFGELITLIEENKRQGMAEELSVVLPYSKESFSIPPNLYIIGTMNTADRSIEPLDTALRRRFSFKEMPPKYNSELFSNIDTGVDIPKMLENINKRIEKLIDKDHQIGHSYFMEVKTEESLRKVFKDKVIPLLEEYFFGDFGKIGLVLGDSFIESQDSKAEGFKFAKFEDYDKDVASDLKARKVYKITDSSSWNFKFIYQ